MIKKKLGEILIDAGNITQHQLESALLIQRGKKKKIGKILIELGYINEEQMAGTLAKQLSLPLINCASHTPSRDILNLISKETAEQKHVLPLEKNADGIVMAMADPLDWRTINDVIFQTGAKVKVVVAQESNIINCIEKLYGSSEVTWDILSELPAHDEVEFVKEGQGEEQENVNLQTLYKESEASPIVRLVTNIIADAVNAGSSDIHIEPREQHVQVRYRIDGNLKNIHNFSKRIRDSVISRIKIISNLDITNRRFPQDGRSTLRLHNKTVDLRISTLPSIHGEIIVIRLLDSTTGLIPLSHLGISDSIIKPLIEIFNQPQGMLLVTGPTGSGKTTTLYSILLQVRSETKNIITLEEPVEYKLKEITQVGINEAIDFTFSNALRSVLRQGPDIVMVGEVRDLDTAEIAARSALTGHLVLSTLHTNDTISSITRLIDIGLAPFLVTAAVSGILAQRLIRKICPDCKIKIPPPDDLLRFNLPPLSKTYKGEGCSKCNHTGYKGRVGVYELLVMNTNLRKLISSRTDEDELWKCAREASTRTMFEDAWTKVEEGITTIDEVISRIPYHEIPQEPSKHIPEKDTHKSITTY